MSNSKRPYVKKSQYWEQFHQQNKPMPLSAAVAMPAATENFSPELCGEPFYVSDASVNMQTSHASYSRGPAQPRSGSRKNRAAFVTTPDRFSSIRNGMLPYCYAADGVNVRDAIELCQKAYANVAVVRNAIDIMSEFANTEIYFEGGSKKSRDFFTEWFKKIKIWRVTDQYFREYYRSGNIFLYRVDGKFQADDFAKIINQLADDSSVKNNVPVRYIMLNPYDIVAKKGSSFAYKAYEKILSEYELSRLQNPINDEDKEILNGLPADVRDQIKKGSYVTDGLKIELDPLKLIFSFYKKQDYEPFAIPFAYPVLEDVNAKLELKKMDQAITRTVENVILLITMGAEPDKGGINQNNLIAMQGLFKNESVGRVLVSDYTTEAQFIIPDLNKVLGPDKYQVLNEDIKQGLQNIVIGEEKYSATEVKAQIFVDRLKEARNAFLNDFLQPEIRRIAKNLGLKNSPTARFRDIDMRDQTQLMRVVTRLMELAVITPQQGMEMLKTGQFPNPEEISTAQKDFIEERKEGFYNPIVGGVPVISTPPPPIDPNAQAAIESSEKIAEKNAAAAAAAKAAAPAAGAGAKKPATNQTKKTAGRPEGTTGIPLEKSKANFSVGKLAKTIYYVEEARACIVDGVKAKHSITELNEQQIKMVDKLCEAVVVSKEMEDWATTAASCVNRVEEISLLTTLPEVLEIASEHETTDYEAALLYHSQQIEA